MSKLDAFLDQAWSDHAEHAAAVAARLPEGMLLAEDDDGVTRLAGLGHHVLGEHLGRWQEGLALLAELAERNVHGADGAASLARCTASLRLCGGLADERAAMTASDQCRVTAMAASNLAAFDTARSALLLEDALSRAGDLPDADPGVRALAANSNNIAATLQDLAPLETARRELMLRAAQVARTQWERAGTWLEVERAEYRLALCWLAAGDPSTALQHGLRCDAIVRENGAPPLELFFAAEALALPARALGDGACDAQAVATARQAFAALAQDDQAWCRTTLDKINAA
ncbi:MAG: hypothetical protein IPI73_14610 [Betaproteobacteria bacterium]|nr:hypothetical protein [Betaproteobacteria bacterium]